MENKNVGKLFQLSEWQEPVANVLSLRSTSVLISSILLREITQRATTRSMEDELAEGSCDSRNTEQSIRDYKVNDTPGVGNVRYSKYRMVDKGKYAHHQIAIMPQKYFHVMHFIKAS